MKEFIKCFLGYIYCCLYGVKHQRGIYVGLGAKLIGGGQRYIFLTM